MIRFCDKEICYVAKHEWDGAAIIKFLDANRDDLVCLYDEDGHFAGMTNYRRFMGKVLKLTENLEGSIPYSVLENGLLDSFQLECLVLDGNIWKEGREYFKNCSKDIYGTTLLPVVDKKMHLVCFAWQDDEANQEMRMLEELEYYSGSVLGFKDIFPQFDCVTVHGCNELAFNFIQYLIKEGISVNVTDKMWGRCDAWQNICTLQEDSLEYKNYIVYAEGTGCKEKDLGQRSSVSAEFECIDQIYEANIRSGRINDAKGSFLELTGWLRGKQLGIIGTDCSALNAYNLLLYNGLDIACFISEKTGVLFGKKILTMEEAVKGINEIVVIEPSAQYSAWGNGGLNDYNYYYGLMRNENMFFINDYADIPNSGFFHVLTHVAGKADSKLVLFGELAFCIQYRQLLQKRDKKLAERAVYCDILEEYPDYIDKIPQIEASEVENKDICLVLVPQYYHYDAAQIHVWSLSNEKKILESMKMTAAANYVVYPIHNDDMLKYQCLPQEKVDNNLKVGKIVIGSIEPYSGNTFIRGLLDNHPGIMMLEYSPLNNNLYSICTRLSCEKGTDILPLFWGLFEDGYIQDLKHDWEGERRNAFDEAMKKMLAVKSTFTSQELFVMIHIAHAKMWGRDITNISEMMIYWEPHCVPINECEDYTIWLKEAADSRYILNFVRNSCIRSGALLKTMEKENKMFSVGAFYIVFKSPDDNKRIYPDCKRIVLKFEDVKCNPQEQLHGFCEAVGLSWSDTLLQTTLHGEQEYYGTVTGFDLAPVYRTHEEFFSAFDRFRISLITGPWQKKYGYPYVNSLEFTRKELKEMFQKKFRFEDRISFLSDEEKTASYRWVQKLISDFLREARRAEVMAQKENRYLA